MENTMTTFNFEDIIAGIKNGKIVPYLGPGVLQDVTHKVTGESIPADSDSLILAMNDGRPMSARLMYEFPRAAMDMELKKGRKYVNTFLDKTYSDPQWSRSAFHDWLETIKPHYVIDVNRDTQLQQSYVDTPHILIRGIARVAGTDYRFTLHQYDGESYHEVTIDQADISLPILFKPMGSPLPDATYIASDADYVDYITELMGGFGLPVFLKEYRKNKQYLFIGLPMNRDTERMVLSDIMYGADEPAGWVIIEEPNDKERRFCKKMQIEIIEASISDLLSSVGVNMPTNKPAEKSRSAGHPA
jgi:hypothetical protein